jgi:outer membrane lipoprotein carrier protein
MVKKVKLLLLLSSLVFISFSCSCLFGRVTNTASNDASHADETINTQTAGNSAVPTPERSATVTPALTAAVPVNVTVTGTPKEAPTAAVQAKKKKTKGSKSVKTPVVKALSDRVTDLLEKIKKAQAGVTATKTKIKITTYAEGGEPQVIKGDAVIKKKDKFRVHYTEPNEQIMISDGKTIYVYTPSLNQAIKQSVASANANTKFYTDFSSSLNHYVKNSSTEVTEDDSSYTFSMVPENKKELDYDSIAVKVSKKDLMPYSMTMKVQGTVSEVEFSETVNYTADEAADNADLADKNFEFKAPDGVEVIDSAELMQGVK